MKLSNPLAENAFDPEGLDLRPFTLNPPPAFSSSAGSQRALALLTFLAIASDTQIGANITVASGTANESVSVPSRPTVTAAVSKNGGNGQSPPSSPANATVQNPLNFTEVRVIGWINSQLVTLPSGANPTLGSNLSNNLSCAREVATWAMSTPTADLTNSTDKAYAAAKELRKPGAANFCD